MRTLLVAIGSVLILAGAMSGVFLSDEGKIVSDLVLLKKGLSFDVLIMLSLGLISFFVRVLISEE